MAAVYFCAESALDGDQLALVDIMCALVGVGLDNVHLHGRLLRHQADLEAQVAARTQELAAINADLLQTQNQINEELRVARTLQQSILPTAFPPHDGYQGHAFMRAARMIGGDFYDMFRLDDHRLGIVVADVSGKGVPAALFMVLVRTILQDLALRDLAPGACLAEANRQLIARNPLSLFVTVIYGIMDSRSGVFTFCSGGHIMPYVLRADGAVEAIKARSAPLVGLIETAVYPDLTIALQPGDGLLLVTDGVAECFNRAGEAFGEGRLMAMLTSAGPIALDRLLDRLVAELDRFSDGLPASDDVTALVVRFTGRTQADESADDQSVTLYEGAALPPHAFSDVDHTISQAIAGGLIGEQMVRSQEKTLPPGMALRQSPAAAGVGPVEEQENVVSPSEMVKSEELAELSALLLKFEEIHQETLEQLNRTDAALDAALRHFTKGETT